MAQAVADLAEGAVQVGTAIFGAIFNSGADKDFRSSWTQVQVGDLTSKNPGKNVMVVFTKHDASGLVNSTMTIRECTCPNSGSVLTYSCYVFDSGPFVLQGDGGYLNWCFAGSFNRNGNNVTFNKLS
ncbi:uncharacterized protein Z519_12684 [Cladophialophora bantiana CBS 173.52]|uniref:Uncharacterized protein n=1 Tax=Cladophialophora bantiana (strain ATCC 10958 / CBS 173.52 / CDC B-1940 / NIH 8579) TaxID=1442370 RepID=A0A0D2H090_CLAB1|nr:uncharacterized protein Z519_12684 [Cladophialophora bantiana CBS 173.52]KIW86698.1 hypothetical protein Z519_12684 [Cladophialophora bantiana CBS 173.52]